jgi:FkbH-like protein
MEHDNHKDNVENPFLSPSESLLFWKKNNNKDNPNPQIRIGFLSTFTSNIISYHFSAELQRRSTKINNVYYAPFGQIRNAIAFPEKTFGEKIDLAVILWRIEDMYADLVFKYLEKDNFSMNEIIDAIASEFSDLNKFTALSNSRLILSSSGFNSPQYLDKLDFSSRDRIAKLYAKTDEVLKEIVSSNSRVTIVNWEYLVDNVASKKILDARNDLLFSDPFTSEASFCIGATLGEFAHKWLFSKNKKLIILDCDNTLWGGVVGEDGIYGIQLGGHGVGLHFVNFQRELKLLKNRGVMLALASKNNLEVVREVFEKNDSMILHWDDFVNHSINWNNKSESIARICEDIGISIRDSVFIDDSEFEIAQVVGEFPELSVLRIPSDSTQLSTILQSSSYFDSWNVSAEDALRTELYQHEGLRIQEKANLSQDNFLLGLELELTISKAIPSDLERVTQLVNKTNQFNLTMVRRNILEIETLSIQENVDIFVASAKDKFGSYGLIGVCIIDHRTEENYIDTLLMSCRALGRGLEQSFFSFVANYVFKSNGKPIIGSYIRNERNELAQDFYPNLKFKTRHLKKGLEDIFELEGLINEAPYNYVKIAWKE